MRINDSEFENYDADSADDYYMKADNNFFNGYPGVPIADKDGVLVASTISAGVPFTFGVTDEDIQREERKRRAEESAKVLYGATKEDVFFEEKILKSPQKPQFFSDPARPEFVAPVSEIKPQNNYFQSAKTELPREAVFRQEGQMKENVLNTQSFRQDTSALQKAEGQYRQEAQPTQYRADAFRQEVPQFRQPVQPQVQQPIFRQPPPQPMPQAVPQSEYKAPPPVQPVFRQPAQADLTQYIEEEVVASTEATSQEPMFVAEENIKAKKEHCFGVTLATNEKLVKTFAGFHINGTGKNGTIVITNKRMLCDAVAKTQVSIKSVESVSTCRTASFSVLKVLCAMLLIGIGVAAAILPFEKWIADFPEWAKIALYVAGGLLAALSLPLIFTCYKSYFFIDIKSSPMTSVISMGNGSDSKKFTEFKIKPNKQTSRMIANLSTVILEVQEGLHE